MLCRNESRTLDRVLLKYRPPLGELQAKRRFACITHGCPITLHALFLRSRNVLSRRHFGKSLREPALALRSHGKPRHRSGETSGRNPLRIANEARYRPLGVRANRLSCPSALFSAPVTVAIPPHQSKHPWPHHGKSVSAHRGWGGNRRRFDRKADQRRVGSTYLRQNARL